MTDQSPPPAPPGEATTPLKLDLIELVRRYRDASIAYDGEDSSRHRTWQQKEDTWNELLDAIDELYARLASLSAEAEGLRSKNDALRDELAESVHITELGALRADKERLDWLEARKAADVTISRCGKGRPSDPYMVVELDADWHFDHDEPTPRFEGPTVRAAMDAARASDEPEAAIA